jgi:Mrp family chromosome partitioning ATPase
MKIKLVMLDSDANYLRRVVSVFNTKLSNELEIYSYTDESAAMQCIEERKVDFFLAGDRFKIDFSALPKHCGFAYLVDSPDIERVDTHKAICKFQKGELIYKQIMSIYSEHVPNITGVSNAENGAMKTIAFCSPCGGVGTSTAAAACAIALVGKGYRVLYLNTEVYGDADVFFSSDGQFDFSDVIYAIKSNKTNRTMKLQSTVKQDASGVSYYSSVRVPLDMMEMTVNDFMTLQNEFKQLGCYDYVVIDLDFPKTQEAFRFFQHCNSVVVVSDGAENSQIKVTKMLRAVQIMDSYNEYAIQPRMWLLKNKTSGKTAGQNDIRILGSFPMYQTVVLSQMAKQLSLSNIYDQLI